MLSIRLVQGERKGWNIDTRIRITPAGTASAGYDPDLPLERGMADQDREEQNRNKNANQNENEQGERDDVAEDRNLSGSSTWLTLPDEQPRGDSDSDDTSDRQSNR
jgi:hypothetical protein